jgi:ParB family transcriptional regulator, chromosome partitioning protein
VAERNRGMGRGLQAILSSTTTATRLSSSNELRELSVEAIVANPKQPRRRFDDDALAALAESLRTSGVLQPVLVRPTGPSTFELIAGERRWRAAGIAGLKTIPAVVRSDTDAQSLETALIENMAREDLNPVEEARACALLVEELGLTREEVGCRVGRSRVAVSNLMRLLDLPDEVLDLLENGVLTEGHGRALLIADDHAERRRLGRLAAQEQWSVRATESAARSNEPKVTKKKNANGRFHSDSLHPDQVAAAKEIADLLARSIGLAVSVTPADRHYKVSFTLDNMEEATQLSERLTAAAGSATGRGT